MGNRFFQGVTPEVEYPGIKTGREDSPVGEGQHSQNRVQSLLRAVDQWLRPKLPDQSTVDSEPGPADDTTQHGNGYELWRYYTPFGPAGMYGLGSRWGGSIW